MSMLRAYTLEGMCLSTEEVITVRLWAYNLQEARDRAIPFVASELGCSEADVVMLGEHGQNMIIPTVNLNAALHILLDIIERNEHRREGEQARTAYQLLTRDVFDDYERGPLPTKGKSEAQS